MRIRDTLRNNTPRTFLPLAEIITKQNVCIQAQEPPCFRATAGRDQESRSGTGTPWILRDMAAGRKGSPRRADAAPGRRLPARFPPCSMT
jgi:hypothetical protein